MSRSINPSIGKVIAVRRLITTVCLTGLVALAASCGGPKTVSRDGYRALLVFAPNEKYSIAVKGENRRVEGTFEGSTLVKIMRPDLRKTWQFRPSTRKIFETQWQPTDEIVPGYPLEPRFDMEAYAQRYGATWKQIGDAVHGIHPCDRYELTLPSGDRVYVWAARDLERLPVRIEIEKKQKDSESQPFTDTQLLDVRVGADDALFEKPKDYVLVTSYDQLQKS
jgi:hypothetical protein